MNEFAIRATLIALLTIGCAALARGAGKFPRRILRVGLATLVVLPVLQVFELNWVVQNPLVPAPEPVVVEAFNSLLETPAIITPDSSGLWFPVAYGFISLLVGLRFIWGMVQLRRLVRSSVQAEPATQIEAIRCLSQVGVKRTVRILIGNVQSPITFGSLKPTIILPLEFCDWNEDQRMAVLLHESSHVLSLDCAWQRTCILGSALYWGNPLYWGLSRSLKQETEVAADSTAISSGCEGPTYASALVEIARKLNTSGGIAPALGVQFVNDRELDQRVRRALKREKRGFVFSGLAAISAAVVGSAAIAGIVIVEPKPQVVLRDAYVSEDPMEHLVNIVEEHSEQRKQPPIEVKRKRTERPRIVKNLARLSVPKVNTPPLNHGPMSSDKVPAPSMIEVEVAPSEPSVVVPDVAREIDTIEVPARVVASEFAEMAPRVAAFVAAQRDARIASMRSQKFAAASVAASKALERKLIEKSLDDLNALGQKLAPLAGFASERHVFIVQGEGGTSYRFEASGDSDVRIVVSENGKIILDKESKTKFPPFPGKE